MTRDPKQTQTMEEPLDQREQAAELDLALRTTLVQPIPLSRHPDFVRTHYWEKATGEDGTPKRSAASYASAAKTVVGIGPDDPIVRAVQAAKQQLLEAERAQQERTSHERPRVIEVASAAAASTAKTVLLPALDLAQLMSSRLKRTQPDATAQAPKRKPKPLLIGGAALLVVSIAATAVHLMPSAAPDAPAEQSLVKPRPSAPAPSPRRAPIEPAPGVVAASSNAPAQAAQVTEKAAVDALFAGDYNLAGRHYTALANAHPDQPAFVEAARLLTRNVNPNAL